MIKLVNKTNKNKGFSFIELMIAIMIFSVGILGVGIMQMASIKGNKSAFELTSASFLASGKLEELMAKPFTHINLLDTNNDGINGLKNNTIDTADHNEINGKYTILWNIVNNHLLNNTKTIKVIVVWNSKKELKNISFACIKAG
ncbi:MAG: hypothetical protein B6I26_00230 [Desulfobacteraceae bacterium 4572_130]|nr:MAG: hypothetical protein B6I26_00230 [Desulfobacteraceae bacterium 4572_130]